MGPDEHSSPGGAALELRGVSKIYGEIAAVEDLNLSLLAGEFLTLLGASGSGKTTTLMMLAGFVAPTIGQIRIGDRDVTSLPPGRRDLGVVFQNYALFPHLTVAQNLAFPLKMRHVPRVEIAARVRQVLEMVHLADKADRYPRQLSGGQQQRVALARAIIYHPQALLMDEPLGALDKNLREQMQMEIKHLHSSLGATMILVTHDQEEALTLSDRIAVMRNGRIAQIDTPKRLYEQPVDRGVAGFIGQSNFLDGTVDEVTGTELRMRFADGACIGGRCGFEVHPGDRVSAVIRPESIVVTNAGGERDRNGRRLLSGILQEVVYLGHTTKLTIRLPGGELLVARNNSPAFAGLDLSPGSPLTLDWGSDTTWCIPPGRDEP